jgi:hypothetical protein
MNEVHPRIPALDELGDALREAAGRRARQRPRRTTAVVIVIALCGLALLTPPGQAAAEWLGRLIGIVSDDSQPQTLSERLANAVFLGEGKAPGGERYRVYADRDTDEGLCFEFSWIDGATGGFGTCQLTGVRSEVIVPFVREATPGTVTVAGLTPARTAKVDVRYRSGADIPLMDAPSRLYALDPGLREELGVTSDEEYAFFVAFLPAGVGDITSASSAEVVASDSAGERIGQSPIRWARTDFDDAALATVSCTDGNTITQRACDQATQR